MRAAKEICDDLETVAFKYERLTALIDIIQENTAESSSCHNERISAALYEVLNGMEDSNSQINNLVAELGTILRAQEMKNGKD